MNTDIIFRIAGIGILVTVVSQVLKRADREDLSILVNLAGLVIGLYMVVDMVAKLFETVKMLFNFS